MERYLLGIDSGTSVVKSVLFDLHGNEVAIARREMPIVSRIPGGSEVDMRQVWALTAETIAEVVRSIDARAIAAVGVSGTACGFWGIDEHGEPVRHAILWNDGRAADVLFDWQKSGFFERIFDVSGNTPFPGYPLSTLCWLNQHEPDTLARTRWLLFHKDWLRYNLTGTVHSDLSDVSYFPGDIRARTYDHALLTGAGIAHCIEKLPPAAPSEQIVGYVTTEASALTGLAEGTPVVAGAVDVVSSLLGGGAYRAGQSCSILGTSFLNTLVIPEPSFVPPGTGVQACIPDGLWARSLVNTSGTMCIDWMVENLATDEQRAAAQNGNYRLIEDAVRAVPAGSRGLIFLPYLNTAGIISPFAASDARGEFFGLCMEHTRADMMRAIYEGVALSMRDCYDVVRHPIDEIILVGGGARSEFWAQLFADATGKRLLIQEGTEFGARGVAILAGVGAGVYPSLGAAMSACIRPARVYTPRPEFTRLYDALYPLYTHLYQHARDAWELRRKVLAQLPQ
jgi:sugar (pentulose or hexulose) kinase